MSLISVKNLSFAYGTKQIFSDINFDVENGQVFALVGPNGCGKTTLEHCLLSHLKAQSGSIFINGKDISSFSAPQLAEWLSYVPQNHARSFPYKTVDVVAMGQTRNRKSTSSDAALNKKAMDILSSLGLEQFAQTEYTSLSGGQLQLVLIARALMQDSKILVMDEPCAHLDVKRTKNIIQIIKTAVQQNKAVIMSTHDFNHPIMLQDEGVNIKMAVMNNGHISNVDTPLKLMQGSLLKEIYDINSQIVKIKADKDRHFIASW